MKKNSKLLLIAAAALLIPEAALASNTIAEFKTPMEAVVGTMTGPVGQLISIAAMAGCGITYVFNRDDITGGFKILLGVVFGISFIAFAGSIVQKLFAFTGAMV
ncbi:TrbC/VirB2 family protein [Maridesulfovibrio sp. FT414]|uniref:TrbC/VirB2 family protein n=1 Tax=Maridesulfovibrio sp. FT414 TaxID=2979469 RepID=UPI003D8016A1